MNLRDKLFVSAIAMGVGIIWYEESSFSALYYGILAAVLSIISLLIIRIKGIKGALTISSVLFVCAIGFFRMDLEEKIWESQSLWLLGSEGFYTCIVTESPTVQEGRDGYARYTVDLHSIRYTDGSTKEIKGTAYVYDKNIKRTFSSGDEISVEGKLTPIRIYKNPGKIDLEGRYKSKRLLGRIYPDEQGKVEFLQVTGEYKVRRFAENVKNSLFKKFNPYMDPIRLHVLMTLLFGGNYNEIPEPIMNSFSVTGIVHILSVSGSHVALLFGFFYFLGKWFHLPRKVILIGSILLVLAYSVLAGFVPPVIRAVVMGILSIGGIFLDREKSSLNLLGACVTGMLLWDPFYLYDVSFQLSVGAAAGILLFYRPLVNYGEKWKSIPTWMVESTSLAISAQGLTIPIILYDFHVFPLYFIPSNLLVTPFLEWVIILGILAAMISYILLPLAAGLLYLADYLLLGSIKLNMILSSLPYSSVQTGAMTLLETMIYYLGVCSLYFRKQWENSPWLKKGIVGIGSSLVILLVGLWISSPKIYAYIPELGPYLGLALVHKDEKILYYKGSEVVSHMAEWEWASLLGYEGIFEADLLILQVEDVKEPMVVPYLKTKEVILIGGNKKKIDASFWAFYKGPVRILGNQKISYKDITLTSNGSSLLLDMPEGSIYFSGNHSMNEKRNHLLWLASPKRYARSFTDEDIESVAPEAVVYNGNKTSASFEDMELMEWKNIPSVNLYKDGMQTLILKDKWTFKGNTIW